MNKLSVHGQTLNNLSVTEEVSSVETLPTEWSRRLIVLIPPEVECTSLTRRICRIAHETNSDIQLLGLYRDSTQELTLQRELITAAALIRDARIYVEASVERGTDWLAAVKRNYQEGDTIICIADQSVGIRRRPLSQMLESTFKAPIYVLTNAKPRHIARPVLSQVLTWSGLIAIIGVFFVLQTQIVGLPDNWSKTALSILILIPELLLIMFWNSLF